MHARFGRSAIGLAGIAPDTGANDIFPRRRSPSITRDHMVQVEVLAIKDAATILAGVPVTLEDVVPGKFDLLLGQAIEEHQQDDSRDADPEGDGMNALGVRFLLGKVVPLVEVEGLKGSAARIEHDVGASLEEERQRPPRRADIDRLPQAIQNEHMLVQIGTHTQQFRRKTNTAQTLLSTLAGAGRISVFARFNISRTQALSHGVASETRLAILSPLRGSCPSTPPPTAGAVGYFLALLRS